MQVLRLEPAGPARTAKSAEKPAIIGTANGSSKIDSIHRSTHALSPDELPPSAVLDTNIALVENNARVGATIAAAWAERSRA